MTKLPKRMNKGENSKKVALVPQRLNTAVSHASKLPTVHGRYTEPHSARLILTIRENTTCMSRTADSEGKYTELDGQRALPWPSVLWGGHGLRVSLSTYPFK